MSLPFDYDQVTIGEFGGATPTTTDFENARVEYFQRIGWWDYLKETGIGPIVGSTQARFRRPVKYPDTLRAGAKVVSFGPDRFTIRHVLASRATGELVTEGDAVVVCIDYRANAKVPVPLELRRRIEELEASGAA